MFYEIRHYDPKDIFILLYHGTFSSFLSCISVWGLTCPTLPDSIFVLQKKALKIITFKDLSSSSLVCVFFN